MTGAKATAAIGVWLILGTVQLALLNVWLIPQAVASAQSTPPFVELAPPLIQDETESIASEFAAALTEETIPETASDLGADDEIAKIDRHLTIQFRTNARAIGSAQEDALMQFIVPLIQSKSTHVIIDGHADARGSVAQNYALSVDRSNAVRDLLVTHGVDASRIIVRAHGSTELLDRETTPQAHARNRRVELQIE